MNYSWNVNPPDHEKVKMLCSELGLSFFISKLLVSRNIYSIDKVKEFLSPTLAIESGEKIAVYGDFDCDGITSTAILYNFLNRVEANATFYNPARIEEGYGINFESIKKCVFF